MDALAKVCPQCGRRYDLAASFCQKDGARLSTTDEPADLYIGTLLLDQFKIEEKIGSGGMGTVYRARQTTLHRDVAIKILHSELADNRDAVRRFKREARVSTALDHPNVVRVFLFGQLPDGALYIVMEHLQGRPLLEVLQRDGALPVHRALHISTQICDGVGEAHSHGIVHRDIKPENIVLITKGRDTDFVKVLDFGIARVLWGDEQTVATQSGLVFGTARYISPEGASGEATDARSDVYSLGVLTYQLLTGETPFEAPSPVAMLMKHIHSPAPHLRSRQEGRHVPEPIADVVMRALAKSSDARFEDAHAFAAALRSAGERAGFEVDSRRHPSSPGVAPAPARSPSQPERPSVSPTPPMTAPPRESETLANAPNPFGNDEPVSLPGFTVPVASASRGVLKLVAGAFLVGALLVGGVFGVMALLEPRPAAGDNLERLAERARDALENEAYDQPPGENVVALTARMLEVEPSSGEAQHLRREAASRLGARAAERATAGDRDAARDLYRRALAVAPGDDDLEQALAVLDSPPARTGPPPGLRTRPEQVMEGQDVTLVAVLDSVTDVGNRREPRFVLKRGNRQVGRSIPATLTPEGAYEATTRVARAGSYHVVFRIGRGDAERIELATDIEVVRDPTRPRPPDEPPPVTTQGSTWSPPVIAPAWNSNDPAPDPTPQPDPEPPPPWGVL